MTKVDFPGGLQSPHGFFNIKHRDSNEGLQVANGQEAERLKQCLYSG